MFSVVKVLNPQVISLGFRNSARNGSTDSIVGFVGLGQMGGFMAANLVKKGRKVVACDVNQTCIDEVKAQVGATSDFSVVPNPAALASTAGLDTVVTMLPSSPHVLKVYTGPDGLLNGLQSNTLCLDTTTGDPAISQQMERLVLEKGAHYLDAPVSGGIVAARDALLTFMVGGPQEHMKRAEDILSLMGKNIFHCGPVGTGGAAKICNNMLLAISMIGTAETFNLGNKLGLAPEVLAKVVNVSSGRCWSSEVYNPVPGVVPGVPSSRDYQGGFVCKLMMKDLGLAQDASSSVQAPTPLGGMALQIYRILVAKGMADLDFGVIYKYLSEQTK